MLYQARGMRFCGRLYWMISMRKFYRVRTMARCGSGIRKEHLGIHAGKKPPEPRVLAPAIFSEVPHCLVGAPLS